MASLSLHGKPIDLKESNDLQLHTETERDIIQFCQEWTEGRENFDIQTSGSTGVPKKIKLSRKIIEYSAKQTVEALKLKKGHIALICLNTKYVGGMMMLVRSLMFEMHIEYVEPCSNPVRLTNKKFDFIALAPLQLETILGSPEDTRKLNKAKAIIIGGAPINENLARSIERIKAPTFSTYGMTETISHIALKRLNGDEKSKYYSTLGDCKIKKDNRGCLIINGKITEYKDLITNDIVEIISENKFEWLGRVDNIINSGGIKFQIEDLERKIKPIMNSEYFIFGIECNRLGQKISVWVEHKDHVQKNQNQENKSELLENMNGFLSKYEKIKEIIFVEKFHFTNTNKIQRKRTVELHTLQNKNMG